MAPNPIARSRRVSLFGALSIQDEHGPRSLTSGKAISLFAYLVLHPKIQHRREQLAELLSPEMPPERVRHAFSDTLYRLRQALGDAWFESGPGTLALKRDANLWVDVWEFETLVADGHDSAFSRAIELYTGDLLPEIYDEWILGERELRRSQCLLALEKLAALKEKDGELQDALLYARRIIVADALHEPAHQSYMRLLGRLGRYGEALAHYEYLRGLYRTELAAEPLAETRTLAEALEAERSLGTNRAPRERTPFVGRTAERATVLAAVEDALAGRGALLAVEGAAGIGKSRFMREIVTGARWRGVTILEAGAAETPGASPFQPLSDALAPILNSPRRQQLELLLPAHTLAALAPLYTNWRIHAQASDSPVERESERFYSALRPLGETMARLTPLLLVFDDLQWADPVLWESLRVLVPALYQHGACVLVSYRRPGIEDTPGWQILQEWDRAGTLTTISLDPLRMEEIAQWIGDGEGGDPVEVHALTGGMPFLICEWLAEPTSTQLTRRYTAARRLHTLSPAARGAVESAAVLGETIPYRFWAQVSDLSPLTLANVAEELTERQWLQPSAAGYAFIHDLIRTAVYAQIEQPRARELHERAAQVYALLEPENARARAFHYDRAGFASDAAAAYRRAGEQDRARAAFREAQSAFERALELMPPVPDQERIATALALAQVCEITGNPARRRTALEEALSQAMQLEDDALLQQALLASGRAAGATGDVADLRVARRQLKEALALARDLHDLLSEIQACFELGHLSGQQGEWDTAGKYYQEALELIPAYREQPRGGGQSDAHTLERIEKFIRFAIARQLGSEPQLAKQLEREIKVQHQAGDRVGELANLLRLLGAYYNLGSWDSLTATASEAIALAEALGDRFKVATVQYIQGMAAYCMGDYAQAQLLFTQARQVYHVTGDQRTAGLAINMLGLVAEGEGNVDQAIALLQQAVQGAELRNTKLEAAYARHDLGALFVRFNRASEAIPLLEEACAAWTEQGNQLLRVKCEAYLGLALVATGERARAQNLADSGLDTFRAGVPSGELVQAWLWALYLLLAASNRAQAADAVLHAAYLELQRQARTIGNHDLRHSFFNNVWLNREIVAAHDRLYNTQRVISYDLARQGVPLGRSVRPDEKVQVRWTVNAPEDEALADKTERRRYRVERLLREAREQDAAPTDEDLAHALGVSRRTILRDMQEIIADANTPSTRKRKLKH